MKWTAEQQRVIDTRDKNILVSAAAGSGKTAVLVARILAIVTDERHPVDIDRLLVVTFTNAAAAEMRQRIRDALEERAEAEPENEHLQRQLVLIHNARITTIHSFCLQVLRNHFHTIGLDPAFRVADEGEVLLLEQDVLKEVLEEAYAEAAAQGVPEEGESEKAKSGEDKLEKAESGEDEPQEAESGESGLDKAKSVERAENGESENDEKGGAGEFYEFLEQFAPGRDDRAVEEAVLALYHFSLGQPWPKEWLDRCRRMYDSPAAADERLTDAAVGEQQKESGAASRSWRPDSQPAWVAYAVADAKRVLDDVLVQLQEAVRIAREPDGPYPYEKALLDDIAMVERLRAAEDYDSLAEAFAASGTYTALGRKKDPAISEEKKQKVQELRAQVKDDLAAIRVQYFYDRPEVLREEFVRSGVIVRELARLAERFSEKLAGKKAEKNVLDFSDLEHLALAVLVDRRDGQAIPTAAAREYAEQFEEIMIDEYQDSNLVQEMILNSVAGRGNQEPNLFMVGDVKQSIYRFRMARPELFMEKYRTYRADGERSCRLDLHKNFRSRREVLGSVNYIFRQIMTENPGGIVYDKDAALYAGASFPPGGEEEQRRTELWLTESDAQEKKEAEARMVGARIRELVGNMQIWDPKAVQGETAGCYRPVQYRDIVILLRTVSGWADTFGEVLTDMGIPCFTGSQKGYFSATEVRTVLSYLEVLDNPVQDIPLAAVLRSPIGGLTDEELAQIRCRSKALRFYDCCMEFRDAHAGNVRGECDTTRARAAYAECDTLRSGEVCAEYCAPKNGAVREDGTSCAESALARKLDRFFDTLDYFRKKAAYTPIHLLLWEILDVTGYGEYAAALPAGAQRKANLAMLVERAIAYEATSYRGLYHFVRYIENLKRYEVDYGEANIGTESDDTVRIMSIHKSKGLEFPVVFVCGMGKQFNVSDIRSRVVMHPELGIGCDCVDTNLRVRQPSLLKKVIQRMTAFENLGEELRVLYVAMTRAKEKLILTGSVKDVSGQLEKWSAAAHTGAPELPYARLGAASTYLDWVVPALLRHADAQMLVEQAGLAWEPCGIDIPGAAADSECSSEGREKCASEGEGEQTPEVDRGCELRESSKYASEVKREQISKVDSGCELRDSSKCAPEVKRKQISEADPGRELRNHSECESETGRRQLSEHNSGYASEVDAEQGSEITPETVAEAFTARFVCGLVETGQLEAEELQAAADLGERLRGLVESDPEVCRDPEARAYLEEVFGASYRYADAQDIVGKLSVSELKHLSYVPEEDEAEELYESEEVVPLIPAFQDGGGAIKGAARGTVYHTFMENLDYHKKDELEIQLEDLIRCGKMSRDEADAVRLSDVRRFLASEIGGRMERAAEAGTLHREQPFVLGVPADTIREDWTGEETVLVQGIIDAWFVEEDGKIVVLDYKTDRVSCMQELAERYGVQLDYYALALQRLTGREVKERVIYSFCLGKSLVLPKTDGEAIRRIAHQGARNAQGRND